MLLYEDAVEWNDDGNRAAPMDNRGVLRLAGKQPERLVPEELPESEPKGR
jgi:hypothetical protein